MGRAAHTVALSILLSLPSVGGCAESAQNAVGRSAPARSAEYRVEIRRTAYGIPHTKAEDWGGLGYGYGYAQAADNLCTLADGFVSFRGERSRFFGPDDIPPHKSTFGQPKNIDADFFFRSVAPQTLVERYKARQSASIQALVRGFAAGYSRYVLEIKAGREPDAHQACRFEPWVRVIGDTDVYRRVYALLLAGGYARFPTEIATAQPPVVVGVTESGSQAAAGSVPVAALPRPLSASAFRAGGAMGIGSNAIAFGADATGTDHGLLFGNPHWYWGGPDRFYQAQLTLPGQINVSGASLLGLPFIVVGFNDEVAWSHTVSTARRFGLFELSLEPGTPTTYRYDGQPRRMTPMTITVEAKQPDGRLEPVTRTLYRTHFGPVVDLSALSPQMGWSEARAFAIRDINADNDRLFSAYIRLGQARSLDAFIAAQREDAAVPWLNTLAVGRNDRRAWYADIGAIPNVSDALAAACTTDPLGAAFAQSVPGVPVLDGSRSACQWPSDADAAQPGAMSRSKLPELARTDYVANMNDSHWLANPAQPLTGYPAIVGEEGTQQSLRTRLGHRLVHRRLAGSDGYPDNQATSGVIRRAVLDSQVMSAQLFKDSLLASVCGVGPVTVTHDPLTEDIISPPRTIELSEACDVLRAWDDTGNVQARGAHLWDAFWARASLIPPSALFVTPFSVADPVNTPRGLNADNPLLAEALGVAVLRIEQSGLALDAPRGTYLSTVTGSASIPLYGGCGDVGYFTVICTENRIEEGGYLVDASAHGNSYLQVVGFRDDGVEPYTLLAPSQSDDPASPHADDYTRGYAAKQWLRVPFTEEEILADPAYTAISLHH